MSKKESEITEIEQAVELTDYSADVDFHKKQKRVLRKIDIRILSLTAIAYMLNHIDRTNLGGLLS